MYVGLKKLCGHEGGRLVHKETSLYALARSCGPLSCTCVDPPDDADNPICCEQRGTFTGAFPSPTIRGPRIRAASGQKKNYPGDKADQHHGGLLLRTVRSRPSARLAAPTDGLDPFL